MLENKLINSSKDYLLYIIKTSSNISNTRDSVSSGYSNTVKRVENLDAIRGVWIANETQSYIFLMETKVKE